MLQLAIEIGSDNVRAVIRQGREYDIVPLGSIGSPYLCPPICLRIGNNYVFGEVAKLNAVSRPNDVIFLSDYAQRGLIDKKVLNSFVNYICDRVYAIYKETVNDVSFIVPPYLNNPSIQKLLCDSIIDSGHNIVMPPDSALAFAKSNLNVAYGDKICIIDMRDYPANVALVSRTQQSYNTLGSIELTDFSINDCEKIIEEKIMENLLVDLESSDNVFFAWIKSEIGMSIAQNGLIDLLMGKDAILPLSFSSYDCIIQQSEFQNRIDPKIENTWSQIQSLFQNIKTSAAQVNQVVLLGSLFCSEFICERFRKCFIGYGSNPKFSISSNPKDDWAMCLSSLKSNVQSSEFVLKL